MVYMLFWAASGHWMRLAIRVGLNKGCGSAGHVPHVFFRATFPSPSAALILFALALSFLVASCKEKKPPPPSPPQVEVITVDPRDVPIYKEWIGTLRSEEHTSELQS